MAFKDFNEFIQPPLRLPFNGKVYEVPKPSIETGLRLTRAINGDGDDLYSADMETQWTLVLGSVYAEMQADNVPIEFVARAFLTALADYQGGRELAEATWEAGTDPEGIAAWFRAKHPEMQAEETTPTEPASTSTAGETATP